MSWGAGATGVARSRDVGDDDVWWPAVGRRATLITTLLGMSSQKEGTSTAAAARAIPYFTTLSWSVYQLKIALLASASPSDMAKSTALQTNLDVDYVITYRFADTGMLAPMAG